MLDDAVHAWFQAHHTAWATSAMLFTSEVHSTIGLLVIVALLATLLVVLRQRPWLPLLVVGVPGAMLLNVGIKHAVHRARPFVDHPIVQLHTYSFPSGHAAGSAALYTFVAIWLCWHFRETSPVHRGAVVALCIVMTLWVCVARVYLGVHFLSDVSAGVMVGMGWVLAVRALLRRHGRTPSTA